jgi:pimeloyl-ACP methyl ester carboxylesterase
MREPAGGASEFLRVRGLRYHVRRFGDPGRPPVFLLHGWGDVSATFAPLAAPLAQRWQVLAPDWRGFGHSQWAAGGYWFPDYVADFAVIADHYSAHAPILLIGHSMGGQAASLYAGLHPERVRKLVLLDSLFLPDRGAAAAPRTWRKWLEATRAPRAPRTYPSFEDLAARVRRTHPQLEAAQALFVARCWGREDGHGRVVLCADPLHYLSGPRPYRQDENDAIWCEVTASTLFLDGGRSAFAQGLPAAETQRRRAQFRSRCEAVIAEAGHMLHFDAPEVTARAVAEFLAD